MRHKNGFKQLNRSHSERKALYRNMLESFYKKERIRTTKVKAKEIRRIAEKIITKAKVKSLGNIRLLAKTIKDKEILMKLFDDIAPRYAERNGGYTRVIKIGKRKGDGADMAYLELIEEQVVSKKKKKKKKSAAPKEESKQAVKETKDKESKETDVTKESGEKTEAITKKNEDEKPEQKDDVTVVRKAPAEEEKK